MTDINKHGSLDGLLDRTNMPSELEKEVKGLQGGMMGAAEKHPLPSGYTVVANDKGNGVLITAPNGKTSKVALFAYGTVRRVITELNL